jgi:hypothetical protein
MTDKMKAVVEAAGKCWHEVSKYQRMFEDDTGKFRIRYCINCEQSWDLCVDKNPSPTDLNELFRLAEKLGLIAQKFEYKLPAGVRCFLLMKTQDEFPESFTGKGNTSAEALLNALFAAIKGR